MRAAVRHEQTYNVPIDLTYLQMLSELGNRTSSDCLLTLDNLPNTSCDIGIRCLGLWCLVDRDDEVGNNVGSNLHVGLHKRSKEVENRFEGNTSHKR